MQLAAYFKILRPFNICISILCVLLGGFIIKQLTFHLLPLILVVSGLAGFANIINDIMDYKIDQVNNLEKPDVMVIDPPRAGMHPKTIPQVIELAPNKIIYVSISGFGNKGPYSNQRVYDPVIQALSGLADIQTDRNKNIPRMVRTVIPDKTTALAAAQAICAALYYREKTTKGQHIQLAMLDVMIYYLWPEGSSSLSFVDNLKYVLLVL